MPIVAVLAAVSLLVLLIAVGKLHPFAAFLVSAILAAVLLGSPVEGVADSITRGIGDMLGSLTAILCLGAMFGRLVADSGAARQIADTLVGMAGDRWITLALSTAGFLVGIPLFYNVGFILMVPLIFSVARQAGMPVVYLAIPLLSGLSIAHGFFPPHPSPVALAGQFGANLGRTLVLGLVVGIPTLAIAGPLFALSLRGLVPQETGERHVQKDEAQDQLLPGILISFGVALLPVMMLAGATLVEAASSNPTVLSAAALFGNANVVMLIALIVALLGLGTARGRAASELSVACSDAVRDVAGILLIVAGAGALKQVFIDGGAATAMGAWLSALNVPPLILGWGMAMIIRIALGSATVAGLTAAGMVQPLVARGGVDPSLMVLAVGAGSLMCSHVNDSGFWMFKEYFGLSLGDTFRSWSLMETLVEIFGLAFTLMLSALL